MITIHKVSFNPSKGFKVETYQAKETPKTYTVDKKDNPGSDLFNKTIINKTSIGQFDTIFNALALSGHIWCLGYIEGHKSIILKEIRRRIEQHVEIAVAALITFERVADENTEAGLSARVTLAAIQDGRK